MKEKGLDATLKAIGDPKGPFVEGDLYLFAGALDKVTLIAHPLAAAKLVGPDLSKTKDSKGNFFLSSSRKWPKSREQVG